MPPMSDDLEIFVFTAANSTAQENLLKSIENPIQPERIVFEGFEEMTEDLSDELNRIKNTAGGFYAWGAEPRGHAASTWAKMARGDYVLAYFAKGYHYVARVLAAFHEPTLATNIWGTNEDTGNTWEYMYFLTKPVKIDAPAYWIAEILGLNESSLLYQGFNRIGGRNREAILNTCGSVQDFVNLLLDYEDDGIPPEFFITGRTPIAADLEELEETKRTKTEVYRILRDTLLARTLKEMHQNQCQICGESLQLFDGTAYSEAHHIKPLGKPHNGPDIAANILVLCPNHHVLCDYGALRLDSDELHAHPHHSIGEQFVNYHNQAILKDQ